MGELIVIHDRELQVAAIVDVENRRGAGPAMAGPAAEPLLTAFLENVPLDLSLFEPPVLLTMFEAFTEAVYAAGPDVMDRLVGAGAAGEMGMELERGPWVNGAGTSPSSVEPTAGEAPADPDLPAGRGRPVSSDAGAELAAGGSSSAVAAPERVLCPNCNGDGVIVHGAGPDQESAQCGMCHGRGFVLVGSTN